MGHAATTLYNSKSLATIPFVEKDEAGRMRTELGLAEDDFVIGFAGAASLENGLKQTMDSLRNLPDDIKFVVAGGSYHDEPLELAKKYAQELKVSQRVIFTGRLRSDTMMRYISTFDIGTALFQPLSQNEIVRVPNKMFNYMAMGVPMAVSDFPNMRNIVVRESDSGLAVDPMDTKKITEVVMYFHDNPGEKKRMGANGKSMFKKNYCWEVQKKKLIASHPIWRGGA
jgi:glycosyltransferase involved in cell wall biosynthesis